MRGGRGVIGKRLERAGLGRVPTIAAVGVVVCLLGWFWNSTEPAGEEPDERWHPFIRANSEDDVRAREQFDLEGASIPVDRIFAGGPDKDGIPAITDPRMIAADDADFLSQDDRVIGINVQGDIRAYPLKVLTYHEVVNDTINDVPIAVTFCPLSESAFAFDRRVGESVLEFGVSGLIYNSNLLMYDRSGQADESLWSQLLCRGVSGKRAGRDLKIVPLEVTSWGSWRKRFPATRVLGVDHSEGRDYDLDPYEGYFLTPQLLFPVEHRDERLLPKARVLGVWAGDRARAYPILSFSEDHLGVNDMIAGRQIQLGFDVEANSLRVTHSDEGVQWTYSLWFAWSATHPDTDVYQPKIEVATD